MIETQQKLAEALERVAAKYVECVSGAVRFGFAPQAALDSAQADAALFLAHAKDLQKSQ